MIDVEELKRQCHGRWHSILVALGVPESYLTGKPGKCIFCGGYNRFIWDNKGNNGGYFCRGCNPGTSFTLVMKHLGINFPEALKRVDEVLNGGYIPVDKKQNNMSIEDIKKLLNNLWTNSTELTGSDHASKYLHSRGLVLQPDNVRFCPECYESDTKTKMPAMLAKIVDKDNIPKGIHRTYLSLDAAKQADIPSPKKMTQVIDTLTGCSVRLFPPKDNTLIVCEGIETGIACNQLFDEGVCACLSSTLMERFEPPEEIRKVIVCGDNDATFTGAKSAYTLAKRLYLKDYLVEVRIPKNINKDFADEIKGGLDDRKGIS